MSTTTRLEPLPTERARELFDLLRGASAGQGQLRLDDEGRVLGTTPAEADEPHVLGDLDVHA